MFSLRPVFAPDEVGHDYINVGCLPSSVKNIVANSGKRITHLQIKAESEIPLDCLRKSYGYTRGFINVSDSELWIYYDIEGIRITSQARGIRGIVRTSEKILASPLKE